MNDAHQKAEPSGMPIFDIVHLRRDLDCLHPNAVAAWDRDAVTFEGPFCVVFVPAFVPGWPDLGYAHPVLQPLHEVVMSGHVITDVQWTLVERPTDPLGVRWERYS